MKVELLNITKDAEKLIEDAGRTSYLSFDKKSPGSEKRFILMIVKMGHESVLEHASATFRIGEVSRAFSHQLVRHRLCSFTQQSQRYIDENNFSYVIPDSIKNCPDANILFDKFVKTVKGLYVQLQKLGIPNEDARFVLPNAVCTEIVVTANLREWRHIIELRGQRGAQWEIRKMAIEILKILKREAPTCFYDFEIDEEKGVVNKISI